MAEAGRLHPCRRSSPTSTPPGSKKVKKTEEEEAKYNALQQNNELKAFHAKHAQGKAFSDDDVIKAIGILEECFTKLDTTLASRTWVMGEEFSLADISWIPLHHVLIGCDFPFDQYPNIQRWAAAFPPNRAFRKASWWCPDFSRSGASHACLRPDQKGHFDDC